MAEARRTSYEEVLHKQLFLPSILEKGNISKTYLEKHVHSKEGMNMFPTSKWFMHTCASRGTSNHDMAKCQRRQSMQENPSKKKDKGKVHLSKKRKMGNDKKRSWFQYGNKILYSYYGKRGHQIKKCWTLYPHLKCPQEKLMVLLKYLIKNIS
jgi:hypothetical protein